MLLSWGNTGGAGGISVPWSSTPSVLLPPGFSLTRASTGTYFDSAGLLQTAAIDAARGTYRWNGSSWVFDGTIVEAAATNICTYSEDYSDASWQKYFSLVTITANQYTAPSGAATMDKLQTTAGGSNVYLLFKTYARTAATYTHTEFLRYVNNRWVSMSFLDADAATVGGAGFDLLNGVVGTVSAGVTASITPIGGGVYRCSITRAFTGTSASSQIRIAINNADATDAVTWTPAGTEAIGIWGAMEELGSAATSYIPTTAAAVTRSADVLTAPTSGLLVNAQGFAAIGFRTIVTTAGFSSLVSSFNGSGGIPLLYDAVQAKAALFDGAVRNGPSATVVPGVAQKWASSWGEANAAVGVNGSVTSGLTFDSSMDFGATLRIGSDVSATGQNFSMVLQSLRLGTRAATDSELAGWTT